jgi:hypothetical protein
MEKLLNLLQEFYWENRKFSNENWLLTMTNWVENLSGAYAQTYIISLQGWFIKWLVDNDKIDLEKLRDLDISDNFNYEYFNKNKSDFLISLLSISDNPIELLISILK